MFNRDTFGCQGHTLTERHRRTLLALPTDEPSLLKQDTGLDPLSDFSQTCDEWSAQRRCRVEQHLVRWCHGVGRDRPASSDPIPLRNEESLAPIRYAWFRKCDQGDDGLVISRPNQASAIRSMRSS